MYNVMQSDWDSVFRDVGLNNVNQNHRDEVNILDQIYNKQICSDFCYDDFNFSLALKPIL